MTALQDFAMTLVTRSGLSIVTCHALHQILPAPNGNVMKVIGAVHACATVLLFASAFTISDGLRSCYGVSNHGLTNFCSTIAIVTTVLLPIFYRYVCQRMGYQTPTYLQTLGYLHLTNVAWWTTVHTTEFISAAYCAHPIK